MARYYEAVGRECGVITERCGHRHRTAMAAQRCGDKQWSYIDGSGGVRVYGHWYNGGVTNDEGAFVEPERELYGEPPEYPDSDAA